ncbi:hypothetical protein SNK12g_30600 [Lactiplantibacillus plantarum]|nr:hypothetical protein AWA2013_27460 [Lactiplantibacillus plantarum]
MLTNLILMVTSLLGINYQAGKNQFKNRLESPQSAMRGGSFIIHQIMRKMIISRQLTNDD